MKVGSFTRTEEPNRHRFTGRTISSLRTGTDGDGRDRRGFSWRVRALVKADQENSGHNRIMHSRELSRGAAEVLDTNTVVGGVLAVQDSVFRNCRKRGAAMRLVETLKSRTRALKVQEVAELLGVTPQQIYRMAASGRIPSFRISGSVRFDPDDVAGWLKEKQSPASPSRRIGVPGVAA